MKRRILAALLSICLIMLSVVCVLGSEDTQNPTIKIFSYSHYYVGEEYNLRFGIENIENINECTIILHYNNAVLKPEGSAKIGEGDFNYSTIIAYDKMGEIELSVKKSSDSAQNGFAPFEFYFSIIGEGNTDFKIEIIKEDCKDGRKLQVDISELTTKTMIDKSEINVEYVENIIYISGHGRITKDLSEYDINDTIPEDSDLIKAIVVEEGITEIENSRLWSDYESLKDIWYPDTLSYTEFPSNFMYDADITIHANGMTYAEAYATKYNRLFELNEGFTTGDLDSNGVFDADDALQILKMAAKLDTLYKWSADADGSGIVDASDALIVLKRAAKLL